MPNIARQEIDSATCHITVTLSREDLKPKLDAEFKKFRTRATIKGFRPGQAPAHYVKSLYGSQIFYDVFNDMMVNNLYAYLREEKIDALGQPLPVENQDRKYTFKIDAPEEEYAVTYEIGFVPAFEIQGIGQTETIERLTISNLDDLANEDLNYARRRMGKRDVVEDTIQDNDFVRMDVRELDGDQPKEGGWETGMSVLMSTISDEALKNEFLTKVKGDTIQFDVTKLEANNDERMIRRYVLSIPEDDKREVGNMFTGVITEVTRLVDAEFNQEFLDSYFGEGRATDEDSARELIKDGIRQFYEARTDAMMMRDIQDLLLEKNQFPLPDTFLKRWIKATNTGTLSHDDIEKDFPGFATNLRWTIIRDRLKDQYEIMATDALIEASIAKKVSNYFQGQGDQELIMNLAKRLMEDKKQVEEAEKEVEYELLFKALAKEFKTTEKPVTSEEFQQLLEAANKKSEAEAASNLLEEGAEV
jgi:trigger factor